MFFTVCIWTTITQNVVFTAATIATSSPYHGVSPCTVILSCVFAINTLPHNDFQGVPELLYSGFILGQV